MKRPTIIEYAEGSSRRRVQAWLMQAGPLLLFIVGTACYAGSRWLRISELTRREIFLSLKTVLEAFSPLVLIGGLVWGVLASIRARRALPLLGLILCATALACVVYEVFLRVK